ncbi:hypothetical protein KDL01_00830 [Actinospica durhamensis]|uniref:Uncharacterized protein n=1 Tax=Actinospica durhamensis TaxID=1508375 RepID=A0A941EI41_9ACTN|nr:hypothetical protein [Actinospica durhamensis]MBR7831781.1 hypothetical protein [Actinospica durhamensis]
MNASDLHRGADHHRHEGQGAQQRGLTAPQMQRLRRALAEIPGLYDHCETVRIGSTHFLRDRVTGTRRAEIPLDETALALRTDIVRVLSLWSDLVLAERPGAAAPRREPAALAGFLASQLDWLAAHPAAEDFATEVGLLAEAAREHVESKSAPRQEIGTCVHPGCQAAVFAYLVAAGGSSAGVRCAAGHTWAVAQWLMLSQRLQANRKAEA